MSRIPSPTSFRNKHQRRNMELAAKSGLSVRPQASLESKKAMKDTFISKMRTVSMRVMSRRQLFLGTTQRLLQLLILLLLSEGEIPWLGSTMKPKTIWKEGDGETHNMSQEFNHGMSRGEWALGIDVNSYRED